MGLENYSHVLIGVNIINKKVLVTTQKRSIKSYLAIG